MSVHIDFWIRVFCIRVEEWAPGRGTEGIGSTKAGGWGWNKTGFYQHYCFAKDRQLRLLGSQPSATSVEGMGHRPCPWLRKKMCGWPPLRFRSTKSSARTTAPWKGSHLPEMLSLEHLTPRRRLSFSTEASAMGDPEGTGLGGGQRFSVEG